MRDAPTILHLDMDAFYAAVEQAAKPSLRGKPVIVGGLGPRGVVATASYEARAFGVHSAMPMSQARRHCPQAAFLVPRFEAYRQNSELVMARLAALSPLVEPLSLDEAYVDLEAGPTGGGARAARAAGERLRAEIVAATGLSASVGLARTKTLAKIASERAKPDGLLVIERHTEREVLDALPVRALPGVGPATAETLRRAGIHTVAEVAAAESRELVRLLGSAHGAAVHTMALGADDRPVVAERESKSVSVEDTYDEDVTDRALIALKVAELAARCAGRLRRAGRSARTVSVKVRRHDFTTLTRSETLRGPTDDAGVIREAAGRLVAAVDTGDGVRLLGVGVSGLADFTQEDLFAQAKAAAEPRSPTEGEARPGQPDRPGASVAAAAHAAGAGGDAHPVVGPRRRWQPGTDVWHAAWGPGWVQGSGVGRVTVRFETPASPPGRVRTFPVDDPDLTAADPLPLLPGPPPD
ncbi:DNA polymerase IV [Streptomyces alkaliterrae]|uniref:DNA polymerase IV n=1 Tax=Streptomyces alkaliterrae TaxID=2213162 RepID=A0A5P0YK28_9ACTN|nr:DNA polymerase IV [Streptomyces alkaliterrae]MBB1251974.1 DNA polymerase IV [Streptomyces alkaliterrae]MBB1257381.1 DNA polymerase IV [Streptomyces alkaliterrae]MQS00723.1 DNA polymerase IV [Streptomyces alkaliterrae]